MKVGNNAAPSTQHHMPHAACRLHAFRAPPTPSYRSQIERAPPLAIIQSYERG